MKIKRRSGDTCVEEKKQKEKKKRKEKEQTYGWKKNEEIRKNKLK